MSERCGITNCVRVPGHAGAHTACPSSGTLDWDHAQAEQRATAHTLQALDFDTPHWADLNDEEAV